jgi:hypothetical protein
MMGIIQMFTKQDMMPLHRALLDAMESSAAYKASTHTEEQIGVVQGESRQSIKSEVVNSNQYWSREDGALIESKPVGVMVVRYGLLNYPNPSQPSDSLYL